MGNYWQALRTRRIARRRALAGAGGLVASAAFLAACGGDDDSSSAPSSGSTSSGSSSGSTSGGAPATNDLLYIPEEASKVTKGGVYTSTGRDVASFTTVGPTGVPDSLAAAHGYSRLVKQEVYKYPDEVRPTVVPDAAGSWEIAPDGLTYTFKIRENFKFDPRPPTSGRAMTSGDVGFSWEDYKAINVFRTYLAADINPSAPIVGFETPDEQTAVFKLAYPHAPFLPYLTWNRTMTIMPKEAGDQFDPKTDMRGSAAWRLKSYEPSVKIVYEPNPDWYDADKINFSELDYFIIPEYASQLSQFTAGNLTDLGPSGVLANDLLPTKKAHMDLRLKAVDSFKHFQEFIRYSYRPDSPFLDERVRQAVSRLLDRDLIIETMNETKQFEDEGIPIEKRWATVMPVGEVWWLDPQGSELGSAADVFKFSPEEAKKLLAAAGHTSAIQTPFAISSSSAADLKQEAQILAGMIGAQGDFDIQFLEPDNATDWRPNYHFGMDQHEGMAYGFFRNTFPDIDIAFFFFLRSGETQSGHVDANGNPDTMLDSLIAKQQGETDFEKRRELFKEIQIYMAQKMYITPSSGDATRFELAQPWLGNWGFYRTYSPDGSAANELFNHLFIDESMK